MARGAELLVSWLRGQRRQLPVLPLLLRMQLEVVSLSRPVPHWPRDGASTGTPAQATTSVTTAPLGVPPASTSTPASSTADASTSAPKSEPAPAAYPSRVQHPPPSIAAGPKPGGGEHRTWLPALPALRVKAPPPHLQAEVTETAPGAPEKAPSPKRTAEAATLAPDETGDPKMSTAEQKQALIPTAPSGSRPVLAVAVAT